MNYNYLNSSNQYSFIAYYMKFWIDETRKIIFGWSAKCGCSHVKLLFLYLTNQEIRSTVHVSGNDKKIPKNIQSYDVIIFTRNPYKKVVSGFLDKYQKNGKYRNRWKHPNITFALFVDEIMKKNWKMIDKHHFVHQTGEDFDKNIMNAKTIKFFDIENIDYEYIQKLFNKNISTQIMNKPYGHERKNFVTKNKLEDYVYDINIDNILEFDINYKYFYNNEIKNKIYDFYKQDFDFFKEIGIEYSDLTNY